MRNEGCLKSLSKEEYSTLFLSPADLGLELNDSNLGHKTFFFAVNYFQNKNLFISHWYITDINFFNNQYYSLFKLMTEEQVGVGVIQALVLFKIS